VPSTTININCFVENIQNSDVLQLDIKQFNLKTKRDDVLQFVSEDSLGINIPKTIVLKGNAKGSLKDITGKADLIIPEGQVILEGKFANRNAISFDVELNVKKMQLNKLLKNERLGTTTFVIKTSGKGNNINTLDATLESNFASLGYDNYDFSDLKLKGDIKNGKGNVHLNFKDENLNVDLNTLIELDSVASKFNMLLDLKGADLYALGITKENIRTKFKLNADFEGNTTNFDLKSKITEGVAVYDNNGYAIGNFNVDAHIKENKTNLTISSHLLDVFLESNSSPKNLKIALQKQLNSYFLDSINVDTLFNPVKMKMDLSLKQAPIIQDVFLPALKKFDSVTIKIDFDESNHTLTGNLKAPFIQYNENKIDSLLLDINSDKKNLKFNIGWAGLSSGPLSIKKTFLEGEIKDKELLVDFNAFNEKERLVHIESNIRRQNDTLYVHINPTDLVLNKVPWSIMAENEIKSANKFIAFKDFTLSRNQQELSIITSQNKENNEQLGINFTNFKLATFTSLLNPDESLFNGLLQGSLVIENPFGDSGMLADFTIESLEIVDVILGNLDLKASSQNRKKYDFDLSLKGGDADLDLNGDYITAESGAQLNLDLLLNKLNVKTIEGFTENIISESEGNLSGKVKISGTTTEPK
jgi:hypothetical protein